MYEEWRDKANHAIGRKSTRELLFSFSQVLLGSFQSVGMFSEGKSKFEA